MGCAASSIDNEEKVLVCRQRKRLMKKLLGFRGEFADAQLAYLRALRNTGVTLRQFTESETLELENTSYGLSLPLPPSPPPTLPPSPPPPPPFSPDLRKPETSLKNELVDEEEETAAEIDGNDDGSGAIPPPPLPPWNFWNPFESLELHSHPNADNVVTKIGMKKNQQIQQAEEENWAETKSQFEEEDDQQEAGGNCLDLSVQKLETVGGCDMKKPRRLKFKLGEVKDDNSSMTSWSGKDLENTGVTGCRIRRTLEGIIRELDDYFLKASGCEKEIAVIVDINSRDTIDPFRYQETRSK